MNVIPSVGPDTAIAPRTGSGSPQTPPQQRADAAPSVLSDSAIQADPGVMLKITPPVMPRESNLGITERLSPDQMAEMLARQGALQQGAVQGLEANAEQADLQVAIRIAQAFDALPADVQEAIRNASSPAIAHLLKLAAMTASGIKEAPAVVRSGPLPLADQPGDAAAALLRNIGNSEMFKLADFLRSVMQELGSGIRLQRNRGDADPGIFPQSFLARGLVQDRPVLGGSVGGSAAALNPSGPKSAARAEVVSGILGSDLSADALSAGIAQVPDSPTGGRTSMSGNGAATSENGEMPGPRGAGHGSPTGAGGPPAVLGAAGNALAVSENRATVGADIDRSGAMGSGLGPGGVPSPIASQDAAQSPTSFAFPSDAGSARAAQAAQAYQGNTGGQMLDQLLGLSGTQPNNSSLTLQTLGIPQMGGTAAATQLPMSGDQPSTAGLSPQLLEQGVRDGLKLLMDGRMVWQGEFTQGVPLRFERSDAWQSDRKALGGMRKGTSIRMQLQLPHLGPLEIRALGFGGQVSVRVNAGPGSTGTLAGFLPDLQARLRQRGLAGTQVVVDAL